MVSPVTVEETLWRHSGAVVGGQGLPPAHESPNKNGPGRVEWSSAVYLCRSHNPKLALEVPAKPQPGVTCENRCLRPRSAFAMIRIVRIARDTLP